jgi:hypothetical protein
MAKLSSLLDMKLLTLLDAARISKQFFILLIRFRDEAAEQ